MEVDTQDTGPAYIRMWLPLARGPLDPLITAILDQPPGRAAERLAPPGRLKRVLDKAHLHLGDLLPDPLRVAHLRSRCELLRVVYEERLGARARPSVDGPVGYPGRAPFARSARRRMKCIESARHTWTLALVRTCHIKRPRTGHAAVLCRTVLTLHKHIKRLRCDLKHE